MGILDNSGGLIPGSAEGGNVKMVEKEHHQELVQILEHNFFGMEGQVERIQKDLVG